MNTNIPSKKLIHKCPFCAKEFDNPDDSVCKNCSLNIDCTLIKCPNCGYEFPDLTKGITGKLSSIVRKVLKK